MEPIVQKKRRSPPLRVYHWGELTNRRIEPKPKKTRSEKETDRQYRVKYGISLEDYQRMCVLQDNRCAVCGAVARLLVDHDHITGKVRELLCTSCNSGLGLFKDSVSALNNAAAYLKKHQEVV